MSSPKETIEEGHYLVDWSEEKKRDDGGGAIKTELVVDCGGVAVRRQDGGVAEKRIQDGGVAEKRKQDGGVAVRNKRGVNCDGF
ncbi:hypothetical protein F2Q69_00050429 [Brassica cretica]|uniref:Uncharacterized protein n=1 Tax=Brassica cretica TaxID=69181 RepID=A0A8S9Q154_BRACR|nr:hypothetical protein F2Q69_00050429 [Brassica cretica]